MAADKHVRVTKRGDCGFHQYGADHICTYGTTISVYESSSAEGPHCWLNLKNGPELSGPYADPHEGTAHLNPEQARLLIRRLQTWLDEIPRRWGCGR